MTDQIQLSIWTVLKISAVFVVHLALTIFLGYQAIFKPKMGERDRQIAETNFYLKEKIIYLSNERRGFDIAERRLDETIRSYGSITNAPDLESAISLFYTLTSNK